MIDILIWNLHLMSCAAMFGIIWVIQLLTYPSFHLIPTHEFRAHHTTHTYRITFIVGPLMALELATAVALFLELQVSVWLLNLASVALIWVLTAFVSVPLHNRLLRQGYSQPVAQKLVVTNWFRTGLWTIRLTALVWMALR